MAKSHFAKTKYPMPPGYVACGLSLDRVGNHNGKTTDPLHVTCGACRRTTVWKVAAEQACKEARDG